MSASKVERIPTDAVINFAHSSLIKIIVGSGPEQEEFGVHESLLITRSEFFRRAMNGQWMEANTRTIRLPNDEPEMFRVWLHFVYSGRLATNPVDDNLRAGLEPVDIEGIVREEYMQLSTLYVLGDKLQDTVTKNAVLKAIFDISGVGEGNGWGPDEDVIKFVYDRTTMTSPLRRLIVDLTSPSELDIFTDANAYEVLPKEFIRDLVVAFMEYHMNRGDVVELAGVKGRDAYREKGEEDE